VASTITWSAPGLIDQRLPFAVPEGISDLACPSIHLCVGTQASGVEIARNPLNGAGAWSITPLPVTAGFPLGPIACASPRLCVAVNYRGQLFTSTNPTGGAGAWRGSNVSDLSQASAVSCPRVSLCIALDGPNVVVSTKPTRPSSWRVIEVLSSGNPLESIACPSSKLCVGTGGAGITWTTSPTGPGWDWKTHYENSDDFGADSIACPSTRLCVAVGRSGNVLTSTDPARGRWKIGRPPGVAASLTGVNPGSLSCPSAHLCVAVSPDKVAVSTNPAGGARTWRISNQPTPYNGIDALACASTRLCVATSGDLVLATANPARGAAGWPSSYLLQGYNPLTAVACPSDQLCVAGDAGGNLVTSSAPSPSASAWTVSPLATYPLSMLSCPSVSFCAAPGSIYPPGSQLVLSTDPSNPSAWSGNAVGAPITAVSCPTARLCVAPDDVGAIHVSGNPWGGPTAWSSQQLGTPVQCERQYCDYDPLTAVSCPSANLCATTDGTYLWTSTDPGAADPTWAKSTPPVHVSRLYCPTESLCLAASNPVSPFGVVSPPILEATSDPADPSPQWTAMSLPKVVIPASFGPAGAASLSGVSCVSAQLCVAVDQVGGYAFAGNPSDPNSWTATKVDYSSPVPVLSPASLTGLSCAPSGRCVAVDGTGHVLVGTASG
jgi:hypothetical protein